MKHSFTLIPWASNTAPAVEITGAIARQNNCLKITYKLAGVSQIILPQTTTNPTRQCDLWEHTCFEFFLKLHDSTKYWEFNLSPAGHWNVFRFPNYRQDIAEEMAFDTLPFQVLLQNDSLLLNLEVELDKIISSESDLEAGITSVVENKQQLTYWALTHSTKEPDFHHQDSFIIKL